MSDYINNIEKKPNTKKDVLTSFLVIIAVFLFVFLFVTIREHGTENIIETIVAPTEEREAEGEDIAEETDEEKEEILDEDVDLLEEDAEEEVVDEDDKESESQGDRTMKIETDIDRTKEKESKMSYYRITAERGEGLTHIARTAMNKYLSDNNINLSAEQKVYAEDYIQRRMQEERDGDDIVLLNEELRVSYDYVSSGIADAQNLTAHQISNLTQFVVN